MSPEELKAAFRCRNCGRIHHGADAGEMQVPSLCSVCGHGVAFGTSVQGALDHEHAKAHREALVNLPAGQLTTSTHAGGRHHPMPQGGGITVHKIFVFENWEVLADATDARLEELGLTRAEVGRHTPFPKGHSPEFGATVNVAAEDSPKTTDKVTI